ncbi:GNAT family N-acetyltransferase [Patescibacteria group bacterium]
MSKRVKVIRRQATLEDVDAIFELDQRVWTEIGFPGTRDMFVSRIETFPEGNVVAVINGKVVGYLCNQLIDYDIDNPKPFTWNEITDNGYLAKTHKPGGQYEYGAALTVDPDFQNQGLAVQLFMKAWEIGVKFNVKACILGCRIPGYRDVSNRYSVEEYIKLRRDDGKLYDPELRLFESDGFRVLIPLPEYETDPASCNYGVLVCQNNPFYNKLPKFMRNILGRLIARWGHRLVGV